MQNSNTLLQAASAIKGPAGRSKSRVDIAPAGASSEDSLPYSLVQIGMIGIAARMDAHADRIFTAVRPLLTGVSLDTARAMVYVNIGNLDTGLAILQNEVLSTEPDDAAAKVVLASIFLLRGEQGWQELYNNVLATSLEEAPRDAAHRILKCMGLIS